MNAFVVLQHADVLEIKSLINQMLQANQQMADTLGKVITQTNAIFFHF
jgi:hypothetical protein